MFSQAPAQSQNLFGCSARLKRLQRSGDVQVGQIRAGTSRSSAFSGDTGQSASPLRRATLRTKPSAPEEPSIPNGSGIKIGVLSDGVTNLATSQATGDLGTVTVLAGQGGSGDEGTAMLEIIHDLAPGAQLFFATAGGGIANFAQNIRNLRSAGCDIIVDDVGYFVESPFQDGQASGVISTNNAGLATQAVNDVVASGRTLFLGGGQLR